MISDALQSSREALLKAVLAALAAAADGAEPRDLPALTRQIAAVSKELDAMKPDEGSRVDDIATRRAARRAKTAS